jgi:tryptophan synthase alpha chain
MSRIAHAFADAKRKGGAFIPFITAGHPDLATTHKLLAELSKSGADIIELGVPFSDPVADGEIIQRASDQALSNGVTLRAVLECAANFRAKHATPIVLFSYFNPLMQFGLAQLAALAKESGIDGILVTDLIAEEASDWTQLLCAHELDPIFLVAPTTSHERLERIVQAARGFIYAISRAGVTGARTEMSQDAAKLITRIRSLSDLPVAVGFGISTEQQVREVLAFADGAVVGSAIVKKIDEMSGVPDLSERVGEFVRNLVAFRSAA